MAENKEININPKVIEYIDKGITGSTKNAYNSDWADFEKFCKLKKYQSLPAKYEIPSVSANCFNDLSDNSFVAEIIICEMFGIFFNLL